MAAALLPEMELEVKGDEVRLVEEENSTPAAEHPTPEPAKNTSDRQWWMKMSERNINRLAGNRHSAHTATQTKWAVRVFRGVILTCISSLVRRY